MKNYSKLLAALAIVAAVGVTYAEEGAAPSAPAAHKEMAARHGKITAVDAAAKTITIQVKDAEPQTIATDDKTEVMVDGKAATFADLKAGLFVQVLPDTGTATKIVAKSEMKGKKKPAAKPE
jgi:hypothetical protein